MIEQLRELLATARKQTADAAKPFATQLTVAGVVLMLVSAFMPWAKKGINYSAPLGGHLMQYAVDGHRTYLLILALAALIGLVYVPGRRRAAMAASVSAALIAIYNFGSVLKEGGGLGAVQIGAWLGVIAGIVLVIAADTLEPGPSLRWPALPLAADLLVMVVAIGGMLAMLVIGLAIDEQKQFLSFAVFVAALIMIAGALGATEAFKHAARNYRPVLYVLSVAAAVAFPFTQNGDATWEAVFARVGVFAAAAIGLNVVVGLAGLLDLGYIAFFGIGGYVSALFSNAVFTTVHIHLPFLLVLPMGAAVAGLIGVAFGAPTLRLRGDYLAIVTLGFGEIFRIVAQNWAGLTRGPNGIAGIPDIRLPGFVGGFQFGKPHTVFGTLLPFQTNYYFLDIILVGVVMVVFSRLNDSRIGRAWVAIREDEVAARAMGINTVALKLLAFGIGATLAGAAGTINVHIGEAIEPNAYQFFFSALLLSAVVLGGMGTVPGAVLGAALLIGLPEKLRFIQEYRLFLFGLALVLLMRFRPEGLIVSRRRQREFHGEGGGDAMGGPLAEEVAT